MSRSYLVPAHLTLAQLAMPASFFLEERAHISPENQMTSKESHWFCLLSNIIELVLRARRLLLWDLPPGARFQFLPSRSCHSDPTRGDRLGQSWAGCQASF